MKQTRNKVSITPSLLGRGCYDMERPQEHLCQTKRNNENQKILKKKQSKNTKPNEKETRND